MSPSMSVHHAALLSLRCLALPLLSLMCLAVALLSLPCLAVALLSLPCLAVVLHCFSHWSTAFDWLRWLAQIEGARDVIRNGVHRVYVVR